MKLINTFVLAASVLLAGNANAQTKTFQGDMVTKTASIEAIDTASRTLTIKDEKGIYESMVVPVEVKRFDALKVGDRINVRYYDNVVVRMAKPGDKAVDTDREAISASPGQRPGGTAATQRKMTVTITAIDPKVPSVTVKGPNGYVYSRKIEDKKMLGQIKVGDQLEVTWTEALMISVEPAK